MPFLWFLRNRLSLPVLVLLAVPIAANAQRRFEPGDWGVSCSRWRGDRDTERVCNVVERTIAAPGGGLKVGGRNSGGVTVIAENARDILVRALVEAHARSESRAEQLAEAIELHVEAGRIYAEGPDTRNREWWSVSYEVRVPARTDLDLKAHNGGIAGGGGTGGARAEGAEAGSA